MKRHPPLSKEYILSRLRADIDRGKVYWIDPTKHHRRLIGEEAGFARPSRAGKFYWIVKLMGIPYLRSQLILTIKSGEWPKDQVDHKNGKSLDDRGDNLRPATQLQNAWNHKTRARRIQLPMGVRIQGNRFHARITKNKKQYHLGSFKFVSEAKRAYQAARIQMFGEFA